MTATPFTREVPAAEEMPVKNLRLRLGCLNNTPVEGHPAYTVKLTKIESRREGDGWVVTETWDRA
jgi:hypothetical protein